MSLTRYSTDEACFILVDMSSGKTLEFGQPQILTPTNFTQSENWTLVKCVCACIIEQGSRLKIIMHPLNTDNESNNKIAVMNTDHIQNYRRRKYLYNIKL